MTYRERRLRKADRLRGWAGKRDAKAVTAQRRVHAITDNIPLGQPILVGHHSERHARRDQERVESGMRATIEHGRKANDFRSRADNIEAAAGKAIYSDDPDAIEQIVERIAGLEAQRARMKVINAETKKGPGWVDRIVPPLTSKEKRDLEMAAQFNGVLGYPAYAFSNLSGNISRQRKRLGQLRQDVQP
jgi:hypothetical protein